MPKNTFQLIGYEIRLDYLTATAYPVDKRHKEFAEICRFLIGMFTEEGRERKPYARGGYFGCQFDECSFGKRPTDSHLKIEVYGELADFVALQLRKSGIAYKTTRADVRALCQGNEPNKRFGHQLTRLIERNDKAKGKKENTMIVPYFQGHGDSGISAHPRGGDWHLRIYDDAFKHQKVKSCIRWAIEGEMRGLQAKRFAEMYATATEPKTLMAGVLAAKLKQDGLNFPIFDTLAPVKLSGTRPTTDIDDKIFAFSTVGCNQILKVVEAARPAAIIAALRRAGLIDENGVLLSGLYNEKEVREEQLFWERELEPRRARTPKITPEMQAELKELCRIQGHARQLKRGPDKWTNEDPFADE